MKHPNHLASKLDKQRLSAQHLPQNMLQQYQWLTNLTQQVQNTLEHHVAKDVVQSLIVSGYVNGKLTVAVDNQTAVNHLRYQCQYLQSILKQTMTFHDLDSIQIVLYHSQPTTSKTVHTNPNNNLMTGQKNTSSQGTSAFSDEVRENITHTAQTVITDERLKKALKNLANV